MLVEFFDVFWRFEFVNVRCEGGFDGDFFSFSPDGDGDGLAGFFIFNGLGDGVAHCCDGDLGEICFGDGDDGVAYLEAGFCGWGIVHDGEDECSVDALAVDFDFCLAMSDAEVTGCGWSEFLVV